VVGFGIERFYLNVPLSYAFGDPSLSAVGEILEGRFGNFLILPRFHLFDSIID